MLVRTARSASVLLAFDGTGDFGPQTPGTRTDGWQEALDFCVREAHDLTVKGGFGGRKPIYHIRDTIRFAALGLVAEHNDFLLEEWRRIHG